jgi:hypothetical protein
MKRVICDKSKTCIPSRGPYGVPVVCGGKTPHIRCEECGKCPRDLTAKCIEIEVKDARE